MSFDVYGLGQCCFDYLTTVDAYPQPDTKCEVTAVHSDGGGPVATALVALARWGARCTLAGVVGDDAFARVIRNGLEAEGVDTAGLLTRAGSGSQVAFVVAEPEAGRRTAFWRRPTGRPPGPNELDLDAVRSARVVHTDGIFPEASLAAVRAARSAGVAVSVDAGSMREGMVELAGAANYFLASEVFARALTGDDDAVGACRRIAQAGPDVVAVTRGARGYVALVDGAVIERAAFPARVVDTTGCGDVFHAGFLHGVLAGRPPLECLELGAWAASRVAGRLGGRAGIPPVGDFPGVRPPAPRRHP